MNIEKLKAFLDGLYYVYARREIVNPDPLYFLYDYDDVRDREIVGLVASSLAYGRVTQIMKSVKKVLDCLGKRPHEFLLNNDKFEVVPDSFKHRFTTAYDMNNMLANMTGILREHGSIESFVGECLKSSDDELLSGLDKFADRMSLNRKEGSFSLVSAPRDGSACKRLFLYLRWMVRNIDVDPGGWVVISPSQLIIPPDVHIFRIASALHLTSRKAPNISSAIDISSTLSLCHHADPIRYDFPLCRLGLRLHYINFSLSEYAHYTT